MQVTQALNSEHVKKREGSMQKYIHLHLFFVEDDDIMRPQISTELVEPQRDQLELYLLN